MISKTKVVRFCGKKWVLPEVVEFEPWGSIGLCRGHYEVLGFRPPKQGEYYLSGAVVQAYRAYAALSIPYLVVIKTQQAVQRTE